MTTNEDRPEEYHYITFWFSPSGRERLERIKKAESLEDSATAVERALRVYDWLLGKQSEGYALALAKNGELAYEVEFEFQPKARIHYYTYVYSTHDEPAD